MPASAVSVSMSHVGSCTTSSGTPTGLLCCEAKPGCVWFSSLVGQDGLPIVRNPGVAASCRGVEALGPEGG